MKAIEAAKLVVEEKSCYLLRLRKGETHDFDAKPYGMGNKRGWFFLDLFTASHIVAVYDNLNDANREKFAALPITKMVAVAFKVLA